METEPLPTEWKMRQDRRKKKDRYYEPAKQGTAHMNSQRLKQQAQG